MYGVRWTKWFRSGFVALFVPFCLLANLGSGQERRILRSPPPATLVTPPSGQTRVPPESRGGFEWERFLGGVIQGQLQDGRRPGSGYAPGGIVPERRPIRRPGYVRPVPERMPVRPPNVVRPVYPNYVPPAVTPTVPGNIVVPPAVVPPPNQVITAIPPQSSPLEGRVWEVSGREARCYSMALANIVNPALAECRQALGKGIPNVMEIESQLEQLRQLMTNDSSWRDIEPVARQLIETHQSVLDGPVLQQIQQAIRMIMVRDAFRWVAESGPRGRGMRFDVGAVPAGVIWIVYDPTLAPGTGLFVNDQVLVCGGGVGDLTVTRGTVAEGLGLTVGAGPIVPDIEAEEANSLRDSITIHNRQDAATAVNYVLNRRESHTIQPGHTQKLSADEKWTIEFDRGSGLGTARYALSKGAYEFRIVESHWEIFKLKFEVTIDNREGSQDFVYVMNNEVVTVPVGKTQTHTGNDPIVVEFDRGAGPDEPARKNLNKNGTYKVAVNTENNYLDLFGEEKSG